MLSIYLYYPPTRCIHSMLYYYSPVFCKTCIWNDGPNLLREGNNGNSLNLFLVVKCEFDGNNLILENVALIEVRKH